MDVAGFVAVAAGVSEVLSPAALVCGGLLAVFFASFEARVPRPFSCCFSPDGGELAVEVLGNLVYPSPMAPAMSRTVSASGDIMLCAAHGSLRLFRLVLAFAGVSRSVSLWMWIYVE